MKTMDFEHAVGFLSLAASLYSGPDYIASSGPLVGGMEHLAVAGISAKFCQVALVLTRHVLAYPVLEKVLYPVACTAALVATTYLGYPLSQKLVSMVDRAVAPSIPIELKHPIQSLKLQLKENAR